MGCLNGKDTEKHRFLYTCNWYYILLFFFFSMEYGFCVVIVAVVNIFLCVLFDDRQAVFILCKYVLVIYLHCLICLFSFHVIVFWLFSFQIRCV